MNTKSLSRMLLGQLTSRKLNSRSLRRLPRAAQFSPVENLEPRLLMTADPDDQMRDAIQFGAITAPVIRTDSISAAQDVDIYRVDVAAGQRLSFDIDRPAGSQLDSYMRLFNASGQQLASNDDAAAPGETRGLDSYLEFTFANAGSFYLGVSGFGNRSYNAVTGLGDRNGRTGNYSLVVSSLTTQSNDTDDQTTEAINLGALSQTTTRTGTVDVATDVDMHRFTLDSTRRVQIDIDRPSGSLDSFLRVFDSAGTEIARNDDGPTPDETNSMESFLDLNLNAGTYFIAVSGFGNSNYNAVTGTGDTNGSTGAYSLTVTPPPPPPPTSGDNVLYLNFDGATISRADLVRYASNDWAGTVSEFDADGNGITVQGLLSNRSDREQIINQIISLVQIDLNPFGITVMRHMGGAVEGEGATTIFLGQSSLSNDYYHVADDIDFGNNNRTDIAFVGNEDWGSAVDTALALADVTLHEAGHTFGLYHVQSGTAPESMGLRYSTPQSMWLTDTRFVDQAFAELPGHGGGRGSQNSFQYMMQTFVTNTSQVSGSGGNPLSPEAVLEILQAGYGHRPHNLPIQEGFGPDGDHDHDHHHGEEDAVTAVFAIANPIDAIRSTTTGGKVSVAVTNTAKRVADLNSDSSGAFNALFDSHGDDDQAASADNVELARQFESDAWTGLMDRLQFMA